MRNTHTDTLAPWERPCWTDGLVPLHDQFGLTAYEARIGRWCFDGDGGDSDGGSGGYGVDDDPGISMTADQAAAAAAAADAAAAAGMSADQQQDAVDRASADMQDMSVDDFTQGMGVGAGSGLTDAQYDSVKGAALDSLYDTDYNAFAELAGIGEYDEFGNRKADYYDQQVAKADAQIADAIQTDAKGKGYDVNVGVDPDGTFSYTAGPGGTFADVASVAGSQIAQGLMDLSPTMQVAQALGAPAPDFSLSPREGSDMAATAEYDPFATGYQAAYDRNMAMTDAPVSAIEMSSVPETVSSLYDNLIATPEYDPFESPINMMAVSMGPNPADIMVSETPAPIGSPEDTYQAAYDRNMASVNQDFDAMVEAENAIGGGGYYDEVFGNANNANMAQANEGGDNPMVAASVPVAAPVAPEPPPTFLSTYQPPQFTPAPVNRLGLLAPPQIYGSPIRQQMIQNYINQYPTLDQAFSRQLG